MSATPAQVVAGIAARLQRITVANGYATDAGLHVYLGLETADDQTPAPSLSLYLDRYTPLDEPNIGCAFFSNSASCAVAGWTRPLDASFTRADTLTPMLALEADVFRALFAVNQPAGDLLTLYDVALIPTTTGFTPRGDEGYFSDTVTEFTAQWQQPRPDTA